MNIKIPEQLSVPKMPYVKQPKIMLDPNNENVGSVLISAVRYACGRRTYMPSIVIDVIAPVIPQLNDKNLCCMERDVRKQERFGYGDKCDEITWINFLKLLQDELDRRGVERWR